MISVVIPLYNKAHTIVNTLNTVINQIYTNFEIVIVNDGSTDNGVEVIKQKFNDSRIRIINQENAGVSAARNRGVKEARNNWIAFLDGDDEWHPEYLEYVNKSIKEYPNIGMICVGGLICNIKHKDRIGYRLVNKYLNKIVLIDFFENPGVFCHTSGTVVNKTIFIQTHGFPVGIRCCEDYACSQAIALISDVLYIGLPLSKYNGGVEGQIISANAETRFKLLKDVVEYYNLIMKDYLKDQCLNKTFLIFINYDIRHRFKGFLNTKNWNSLSYFYSNLNNDIMDNLFRFEKFLFKNKMRKIAILWVNLTKVIWRLHRYPIVGEKVNTNKIPTQYKNW